MIESIREQAALIQDKLWNIAKDCYGLDRTQETVDRIIATTHARLNKDAQGSGLPPLGVADVQPIETGLALAFMCASLVGRETDPNKAVRALAVAAEVLGMQSVTGGIRILGKEGPIDLEKLGAIGESLLHGVLAKGHASAMAKMRHAEDYALADDARKFWRENISPDLSAQKAATELEKVVCLSHKKLAELVSAEKKKVSRVRRLELVRRP